MGLTMAKCETCGIEILDETEYCPLCRSILVPTVEVENMYPDVRFIMKKLLLLSRIYLFCAILVELVLFTINYYVESTIWWSALAGMGLLSVYIIMRYAILGKAGYQYKIMLLAAFMVLMAVGVDNILGYRGWSVNYVLPAGIVTVDAIILVLMFVNNRTWYSYIMWQLVMILLSILPPLLFLAGVEDDFVVALLPMTASVLLFLGTMIIGDRGARQELKRRFHFK